MEYIKRSLWQEIKMDVAIKNGIFTWKNFVAALLKDTEFHLLLSYRMQNRLLNYGVPGKILEIILRILTVWYTSCHIQASAKIEGGVDIRHANGIIIGKGATILSGTKILHQVTIGVRDYTDENTQDDSFATIGRNVLIGAGAKILGKVTIGDNASIGANSVVLKDVPANCTAVGVPAVIKMNKIKLIAA